MANIGGNIFQFGRKEKVNQVHQELQIQLTQRSSMVLCWCLIVYMCTNLLLSSVYLVLRQVIEIKNEKDLAINSDIFDIVSIAVSVYGLIAGISSKVSLDKMDKSSLLNSSRLLFVLSIVLGIYGLSYGGIFNDFFIHIFEAYSLHLSAYILVVVFLSALVSFAVLTLYLKISSLTENISNYYNLNKNQGGVYKSAMQTL